MTHKNFLRRTSLAAAMLLGLTAAAQAALIDRGNGFIYDTALNVTWLQNANLAAGSSFDDGDSHTDGKLSFSAASAWVSSLIFDGVSGWRLPSATIATSDGSCDFGFAGTDCGYNVNTSHSELAYLFTTELGNRSVVDASGNPQTPYGLVSTGPFIGLKPMQYWTGTTFAPNPDRAWNFDMNYGYQNYDFEDRFFYGVMAVHDGDIAPAVPEPATWGLMLAGVVAVAAVRRRHTSR
jgi:hypothetical protein